MEKIPYGTNSSSNTNEESSSNQENSEEGLKETLDALKQLKIWLEEFAKDPVGVFLKAISKAIRKFFDAIQSSLNQAQTIQDGIPEETKQKVMYSYEELLGNYSVLNKYTQVGQYEKGSTGNCIEKIDVENDKETENFSKDPEDSDFNRIINEETKIPVIPVELYGLSIGSIDLFSVDFIRGNESKNENTFWNNLRNAFTLIVHAVLYLSLAILLTMLIYHGLSLVYGSLTPQKRVDHIDGIKRFAVSLAIIVGTILFMAICTYASHFIFSNVINSNGKLNVEFPIRMNVKNYYSFSTNVTGYFRFMAMCNSAGMQFLNTIIYGVLVLFNAFYSGVMFIRVFVAFFLGIIGPIIAVTKVLKIESKLPINYEKWMIWYLKLSAVQLILAITYLILIKVAIYST